MQKLLFPIIILFSAVSVSVTYAIGGTSSDFKDENDTDLVVDSIYIDSIAEVRRQERINNFVDVAHKDYLNVKQVRFDGADEKNYYPIILRAYKSNRQVLDSIPEEVEHVETSKAVLMDIRQEILEASAYYSEVNNYEEMANAATAYVEIPRLNQFRGVKFANNQALYPSLLYISASKAYNEKDFTRALDYFDEYLASGADTQREMVYTFYGRAAKLSTQHQRGIDKMADAMTLFPANRDFPRAGLQLAQEAKLPERMEFFLEKALIFDPGDEMLLNTRGKLYEDMQEPKRALETFQQIDMIKPHNLSITKHLALNYFNLGVLYYNKAIMAEEEKEARRFKRQSNSYFNEATRCCEAVLATDPSSIRYLEAAAVAYGCLDQLERFEDANQKLRALGRTPINQMSMPSMIAFNADNTPNFGMTDKIKAKDIPSYNEYASAKISAELSKWSERGTFEKIEDYNNRLQMHSLDYVSELSRSAEEQYIKEYGQTMRITDMKLHPYDPDNECYKISTSYGDIVLPVPIKGKEAETFASVWNSVNIRAPKFFIKNDKPAIARLTFVTPNGKTYVYDAAEAKDYTFTIPQVDWTSIVNVARNKNRQDSNLANYSSPSSSTTITYQSDVDKDIPLVKRPNDNTIALIISNENYHQVAKVASAIHDGDAFAEYCEKTLGIPKSQIIHINDATLGLMRGALTRLRNLAKNIPSRNDLNIIVYYAGHGMPDEATKDAYVIPVDGNSFDTATCLSLNELYKDLGAIKANNTMVFLDACFSGAQRGEGMLNNLRGVALKPKQAAPQGNMFVFSATTGQETAMPYSAMNHGMFTYFFLKKLKESKGNATLAEIVDYVTINVKETSGKVNNKSQTPTVTATGSMANRLSTIRLR